MSDFFGASTGSIDELAASGLKNDFATVANNDIFSAIGGDRVEPRDIATGVSRGSQRINNTDGSFMVWGLIPDTDGEFGLAFFDKDGNLQAKYLGATDYKYRKDGSNYYQAGELPNGTQNIIVAKEGKDVVEDVFGG